MSDLLLELLSEEIPASMQQNSAQQLKKNVTDALVDAGLIYEAATAYATPRRLVLDIRGLPAQTSKKIEERKGPSTQAPQQAIDGFIKAFNLTSINDALIKTDTKNRPYYAINIIHPPRQTEEILREILPQIIRDFSWPKSMRWGKNSTDAQSLRWIRPLRSILCLLNTEGEQSKIIPFQIDDIKTDRLTYGHRFLSDSQAISIQNADDYLEKLEKAFVILDVERRKNIILTDAKNICFASHLELVEDPGLLDEIAGLVEWPVVLIGEFSSEFLKIPAEIIRLTIKINQKCFVTRQSTQAQQLSNHFILVANIETADHGKEIIAGNRKVISARLSDALYFWQTDQKPLIDLENLHSSAEKFSLDLHKPLDQRMARLDHLNVTFHARLGTQGERVQRIGHLAQTLAPFLHADPHAVRRAAFLAKADLQSEIVGEFPELQGTMGHQYALLQGEKTDIAQAIEDHYKPQGPQDSIGTHPTSVTLALADKIDTLATFWLINEKPTGSRDPYALRRAALGIIRLILSKENHVPLLQFFAQALQTAYTTIPQTISQVTYTAAELENCAQNLRQFIHERFKIYLKDLGARYDIIEAVLGTNQDDLLITARKIEALTYFLDHKNGQDFYQTIRRIFNILETEKNLETLPPLQDQLLTEQEEKNLYMQLIDSETLLEQSLKKSDFANALQNIALLQNPIDAFFDKIFINDSDIHKKQNRLALLIRIRTLLCNFADFTKITK